jgi:ADP-heptose:LPS heptosyltransferase
VDKKALVVRLSSLGDVVLASCVIDPLLELGYKPYLLTFRPYGDIFAEDPRLEVIQVSREALFSKELLHKLRGFDLYVDLHRNLRTFLLRLRLGGRWEVYRKESIRRRLAVYSGFFRKPYSVVKAYAEAIGAKDAKPRIVLSEERLRSWESKLGKDYVCIGPGARYEKKRYPYFRELAGLFLKAGYRVVLVGDARDRRLTEGWEGINLCGELSLLDVSAVIKKASVFIGNDSGLLHIARAVGTPAVQVYGGTHPTLGFAVSEGEGTYLLKGLYCQPCDLHGKGGCRLGDYPYPCLRIDPHLVFETALRLLPG